MPAFTDDEGRVWHPRIDVLALFRVQEETGKSMLKEATSAEDVAYYFADLDVLLAMLFASVRKEATERGIQRDAFLASMQVAETLMSATGAVVEAFADFFRPKSKAPPAEEASESPGTGGPATS